MSDALRPDHAKLVRYATGLGAFDAETVADLLERRPWPPGQHVGEVLAAFRKQHEYLFPPMPEEDMPMTYAELTESLRTRRTSLLDASDREKRLAEHAEWMKPTQRGGTMYYAADEKIRQYEQELLDQQVTRIQEAREAVRVAAAEVRAELPTLIDRARELPSDLDLYRQQYKEDPGANTAILLDIRSSIRDQRLETQLKGLRPSVLAAEYREATGLGDLSRVRLIERQYRTLASVDANDTQEVTTLQRLGAVVAKARDARVSPDLRALQAELDAADVAVRRSEDFRDLGDLESTRPPAEAAAAGRYR
ncbi:MAG: hypothetical protein A3H95_12615 [Acidobacteria bacterium RIFCSPLOWO2_02_FULL_64_15]|nr:MAG: hypothetical protein A3H95_12615 [Acidobacteria bacterium RIFCSPLOWO2_02_FULL_64_15]